MNRDGLAPVEIDVATVERAVMRVFGGWGYREITVPTVFPADVLEAAIPAEDALRRRVVQFLDRDGRLMALRPDWTIPIARRMAFAPAPNPGPQRLAYAGPVFRLPASTERDTFGLSNPIPATTGRRWVPSAEPATEAGPIEHWQAGVELLGETATWADAEMIALAAEALSEAGLVDFVILLGHAALPREAIAGLMAGPDLTRSLGQALAKRDLVTWERLVVSPQLEPSRAAAVRSLMAYRSPAGALRRELAGGPVGEAAGLLGPKVLAPLARLATAAELAETAAPRGAVAVDLGLVRDLSYYTGVVIEAYASGCGRPLLVGGRYDALFGGQEAGRSAVGVAVEISAVLEALAARDGPPGSGPDGPPIRRVWVTPGRERAAFAAAAKLRRQGLPVVLEGGRVR